MRQTTTTSATVGVHLWRHPRPIGVAGRCIGITDVAVDPRKAKRLAHRIRQQARLHGWPSVVYTSPLQRCAAVGRWLKKWGWRHVLDPRLSEMNFGQWDGLSWTQIPHAQVDAWVNDFLGFAPGEGESLDAMLKRVASWTPDVADAMVVAHAGWMRCQIWRQQHGEQLPTQAMAWPQTPRYGAYQRIDLTARDQ